MRRRTNLATLTMLVFVVAFPATPAAAAETCNGVRVTILGTAGNDELTGTMGRDVIDARGGDDLIKTRGGDDLICGGDGGDRIYGQDGADTAYGGDGTDMIYGGNGHDRLYGRTGRDFVFGGRGDDRSYGGDDHDYLLHDVAGRNLVAGGSGRDYVIGRGNAGETLDGGPGVDTVNYSSIGGIVADMASGETRSRGGGNKWTAVSFENLNGSDYGDIVYGTSGPNRISHPDGHDLGNDTFYGRGGNDTLLGASGDDTLYGGTGDDTIEGESGDDTATGGDGEDRCAAEKQASCEACIHDGPLCPNALATTRK